ncbi:hypothetical protein A1O3_03817 [Capronia epimyces CBS 606.96]|uniref:Small ribosomal subunit protein mS33 n=1 Tax=Capronia epimyces CBS 606.96 TaxID=1182542 RepID=W9Y309_9EURO|nr:uncharacterized protein A1O3_03817 [Capronia epimyces CBS 606.96]EXJ86863.1 hypothetical protein A1O3_03817 [Capronia epimyces CBS 606.96]
MNVPGISANTVIFLLQQLQCSIFSTTFNPNRQRLGNKVLRQRLKGPALAAYYPRRSATVEDVLAEFKKFDLDGFNEDEEIRLESIQIAKLRGKGAPKKKRTASGTYYAYDDIRLYLVPHVTHKSLTFIPPDTRKKGKR